MARRVLSGAVRCFIGLAVVLGVAAVAPSASMGLGVGYQYLTTYSGTYTFTQHYRSAPNKPDGLDTTELYEWVTYDYETIDVNPDHSFTRTLTRYVLVRGTEKQVDVQGSGFTGGPFTTTRDCAIYSDRTPVKDTSGGPYIQPVFVKSNPAIAVHWSLPDYGARPTNQAPPFHVSGTADCPTAYASSFLDWTVTQPGGPLIVTRLAPTRRMRDAFDGVANIRYSQVKKKPWTRPFKNVTIADSGTSAKGSEQSKVIVNSTVTFERVYNTSLPNAAPNENNKIGSLLIDEGFLGLKGQGPGGGPPVGASGDPETVLVPGLGPGEITLDVQGTVVQKNRDARSAAGSGILLASARARVRRGGRPVKLTITPTAAGHRLLTAAHGTIDGRYILGFRPRGSKRTYHAVETFTIPPRT